jgi:hypothetical protein
MGWGENVAVKDLDEDLWQLTTDVLFGEIWSRPGCASASSSRPRC